MRRTVSSICAALLCAVSMAAYSQAYPGKPVRFLVGFTPGGGNDIVARIVATKITEIWGQQLVVENRPGAGSNIAAEAVARAVPDGYTLLLCITATHAINPALYKKIPYDHIRDFAPVSLIGTTANVLVVHPSLPVKSVGQFIAYAKANPGKISYASGGVGTSLHLSMELLRSMTGINVVHIPYKGTGPAATDLIGGQVPSMFGNLPSQLPNINNGRLRPLGVTSARRSAQLPDVPTFIESGVPGFEVTAWYGICAPAGMPGQVLAKLNADAVKALNSPDLRQRLTDQGVEAAPSTPGEFSAFIQSETVKWAKVVRSSGATAE